MSNGKQDISKRASDVLRRGRHWLAGKYREVPLQIAGLRRRLTAAERHARDTGVRPENMVWIFGSGRSGSTWLRSMMGEIGRHQVWEEPMIGQLFGNFRRRAQGANLNRPDFIMADATREGWVHSIRNFALDGAKYARPTLGPDHYLVIKEPNGSVGAPILMEALPESRMILLLRDPRDVVASTLDGARKGNWLYERKDDGGWKRDSLPDSDPDAFTRRWANVYLQHAGAAKRAYEAHRGPKTVVRYEELRSDTLDDHAPDLCGTRHPGRRGGAGPGGREALLGEHPGEEEGRGQVLPQGQTRGLARGPHPRAGAAW